MKYHVRIWEEEEVACELPAGSCVYGGRIHIVLCTHARKDARHSRERARLGICVAQIVVCPRMLGFVPSMVPVVCIEFEFEGYIRYEDIGCIQISQLLWDTDTPSGG